MNYPNKIKIGVCGGAHEPYDPELSKQSYIIGQEIAKLGCTIVTGATHGYPYESAKGATEAGGVSLGISPADGKTNHGTEYKLPYDVFDPIVYTGVGFQGRNIVIIRSCDAVIFVGGGSGTLNEFTAAFRLGRPLGILKGSGAISDNLDTIVDICTRSSAPPPIFHDTDPVKLVHDTHAAIKKYIEILNTKIVQAGKHGSEGTD